MSSPPHLDRTACAAPVTAFVDGCELVVVIVNYRVAKLSIDCLRSLQAEVTARGDTRVVIVDNDSGDGSAQQIAEAIKTEGFADWALPVVSAHNGGYAFGNNLAVRAALLARRPPAYFLLLNPDTQVRPRALTALVDFMRPRETVGITGSLLFNVDGSAWRTAFRFPTVLGELEAGLRLHQASKLLKHWVVARHMGKVPEQVDWLPGASMMVRREVFDAIGLMDEKYFLYYEETDFCLQAKRAGFSCWYVPDSEVMHVAGQSTGVTDPNRVPKRRPAYVFESRLRYFRKNHGLAYAALADLAWATSFATYRLRRVLQRKPDTDPPHLLVDSLRHSVFLKLRQRP